MKKIEKLVKDKLDYINKISGFDLNYVASGTFWLMIGNGFLALISLFVLWMLANFMPKEEFGFYQFFIATISIITITTLPGMRTSIIVAIAQKKDGTYFELIRKRLLWGILGSLSLLAIAAYFYIVRGSYWELFIITALIFPFLEGLKMYNDYFNARKDFRNTTLYNLGAKLTTWLPITFIFFLITKNIYIVIILYLITQVGFHIFATRNVKKILRNNKKDSKAYRYGWLMTVNHGLNLVGNHIDKIIVTYFFGFVALASYAIIRQFGDLVMSFSGILKTIVFPRFSELNEAQGRKVITTKWIYLLIPTIIFILFVVILIDPIIRIFFSGFTEIIFQTQVLLTAIGINYFSALILSYFMSHRESKLILGDTFSYNIIKIGAFVSLIPFFGLWGGVLAIVISDIWRISYLVTMFIVSK